MAELSRIWNVTIRLATLGIRERSFSDFMIYGPHAVDTARTMVITDSDQLLDMGIQSDDPLYIAAADAFGQTPAVDQVYIGRQQVDSLKVTVDAAANNTAYNLEVSWVDTNSQVQTETITFTSTGAASKSAIATGLAAAITASVGFGAVATGTASSSDVTIAVNTTGMAWSIIAEPNMSIARSTYVVNETVTDGLAAAEKDAGFWYGLILTSRSKADVKEAMDWAEANDKLFITATNDANVLQSADTTSIAYYAQANNYLRTAVMYQSKAGTQYPDAGWMSDRFTYHPGAESWANVRLESVFADTLPEGDYIVAKSKNASTYEVFRNFAITQGGKVAGNEWIDVIRFRDYLVEQCKVNLVGTLVRATNSTGKIPFTDTGIAIIVNSIRDTLDREVGIGIALPAVDENGDEIPSYIVSYPLASEISDNDKAMRVLSGIKFTARLSGAIHNGDLVGSLVYSL